MRYSKMEELVNQLSQGGGTGGSGAGLSPGLALEHFSETGNTLPTDATPMLFTPNVPGPCLVMAMVGFSGAVTEDDIRNSVISSGIQIEGEDGMWTTAVYHPYNVTQDPDSLQYGSDAQMLTFICPAGHQYGFEASCPPGANVSPEVLHIFEQSLVSGVIEQ